MTRSEAIKYCRAIRNARKREYAFLCFRSIELSEDLPDFFPGLGSMAAQAVRQNLWEFQKVVKTGGLKPPLDNQSGAGYRSPLVE